MKRMTLSGEMPKTLPLRIAFSPLPRNPFPHYERFAIFKNFIHYDFTNHRLHLYVLADLQLREHSPGKYYRSNSTA